VGYPSPVLTVLSWFAARRSRKSLRDIVSGELRPAPTLLAMLSDRYTNEDNLRPFAPLAEQLGDRMHVFLLAEWPQDERERDGDALLRSLGLSAEARPLLLRDEGDSRMAVVLRQRQPIALINLFFRERKLGVGDREDEELRAWEGEALGKLEQLLVRLPPQPPPPPRALLDAEHDWLSTGLCRKCGQGAGTLLGCGVKKIEDPAPRRDRFQLIELD